MTNDELRRRSVRDVEQTSGHPTPMVFHPGEWIVIAAVIAIVTVLIWMLCRVRESVSVQGEHLDPT